MDIEETPTKTGSNQNTITNDDVEDATECPIGCFKVDSVQSTGVISRSCDSHNRGDSYMQGYGTISICRKYPRIKHHDVEWTGKRNGGTPTDTNAAINTDTSRDVVETTI